MSMLRFAHSAMSAGITLVLVTYGCLAAGASLQVAGLFATAAGLLAFNIMTAIYVRPS